MAAENVQSLMRCSSIPAALTTRTLLQRPCSHCTVKRGMSQTMSNVRELIRNQYLIGYKRPEGAQSGK